MLPVEYDFTIAQLPLAPPVLSYGNACLRFEALMPGNAAKGLVPYYHFKIYAPNAPEPAGHINFRTGDNPHIRLVAGHIGYAISPPFRGNALSYDACLAIAPFVRSIYNMVILTADPENYASLSIMKKLNAIFIDQVAIAENDPQYAKGARTKVRYLWKLR